MGKKFWSKKMIAGAICASLTLIGFILGKMNFGVLSSIGLGVSLGAGISGLYILSKEMK